MRELPPWWSQITAFIQAQCIVLACIFLAVQILRWLGVM